MERAVMDCPDRGVVWCSHDDTEVSSFAGLAQIYSDKSQTTVKASRFQFYPVRVTLHNVSEEHRRHCILNGLKIVGYLPVTFDHSRELDRVELQALIDLSECVS